MQPICINDSEDSPSVFMDLESGRLIITGISILADPRSTYIRLIDLIKEYSGGPSKEAYVSILLQDSNSHSLVFLLEVLRLILETKPKEDVHVDWLYDNRDMELREKIEVIEEILEISINKVAYEKMDCHLSKDPVKAFSTIKAMY